MTFSSEDLSALRDVAVGAAREAGALVEQRARAGVLVERKKAGESLASQVVTEVDRASEALLLDRLAASRKQFDLGLLTEEQADDGSRFEKAAFWCVDPLDGTLPFIEGRAGYAVSVALVSREGVPLLGVAYDPRRKVVYEAARGQGCRIDGSAFALSEEGVPGADLKVLGDRSLLSQAGCATVLSELAEFAGNSRGKCIEPSLGAGAVLNACDALQSGFGCYFKLPKEEVGGGSVWDFAATACLYAEAGGIVTDMAGSPLDLNPRKSCFMNKKGVLFATQERICLCIRKTYTKFGQLE